MYIGAIGGAFRWCTAKESRAATEGAGKDGCRQKVGGKEVSTSKEIFDESR
jgi:hypothetical protein